MVYYFQRLVVWRWLHPICMNIYKIYGTSKTLESLYIKHTWRVLKKEPFFFGHVFFSRPANIYIYIYIYMCVCLCVCVLCGCLCLWEREREREREWGGENVYVGFFVSYWNLILLFLFQYKIRKEMSGCLSRFRSSIKSKAVFSE